MVWLRGSDTCCFSLYSLRKDDMIKKTVFDCAEMEGFMEWSCLEYEVSQRGLWEQLASMCREQEKGDFPIPEDEEGETGFLFLCREKDITLGALSAVTFDRSQYYFYPWCLPKQRQQIGPVLCKNLEARLLEDHKVPLLLSCYVNGSAESTIQMLQEQEYVCTSEEFVMQLDFSQAPVQTAPCSIRYSACSDKSTLKKLYQDIFGTSKKEAAVYIDSITEESSVEFFTLSGVIPCAPSRKNIGRSRNFLSKKKILGMFGLISHGHTVYLCSFGILPKYRRQGLGLAALQEICTTLKDQYGTVAIHVSGSNLPAMELYRTFGFHIQEHLALYEKELG